MSTNLVDVPIARVAEHLVMNLVLHRTAVWDAQMDDFFIWDIERNILKSDHCDVQSLFWYNNLEPFELQRRLDQDISHWNPWFEFQLLRIVTTGVVNARQWAGFSLRISKSSSSTSSANMLLELKEGTLPRRSWFYLSLGPECCQAQPSFSSSWAEHSLIITIGPNPTDPNRPDPKVLSIYKPSKLNQTYQIIFTKSNLPNQICLIKLTKPKF